MKLSTLLFLLLTASICLAEDKNTASNWRSMPVTVSTLTATAVPTTPLSGRYKINVINAQAPYGVAIGTHSALTFANGYVLTSSNTVNASVSLYLPKGTTVYAIGEGNNAASSVNVRIMEFK